MKGRGLGVLGTLLCFIASLSAIGSYTSLVFLDGLRGSGVESLPHLSQTILLNLLLSLVKLFMSYMLDSDSGMFLTKSLKYGSFS